MSKTGSDFDPDAYTPVGERIRLFYDEYPLGRIETELVRRTVREVVFKALVYRDPSDDRPAATGWAAEREGDGDVNTVACLENTETSAIGRALANLGFTASKQRPSANEMVKASRPRARHVAPDEHRQRLVVGPFVNQVSHDVMRLLVNAERAGASPRRIGSLRARVIRGCTPHSLERLEAALRDWLRRRQAPW